MADTVNTHLTRIETAKADIRTSIINKGVDVPTNAKIDALASYIDQITGGGGDEDLTLYNRTTITGFVDFNVIADVHKLYCGSTTPSSSIGKDGDIYIKY